MKDDWDPLEVPATWDQPSAQAVERIVSDVQEFRKLRKENSDVEIIVNENISIVHALIKGQFGTPYGGGSFRSIIRFPPDYPSSPLRLKMLTGLGVRLAPNIHPNGKVCLDCLSPNVWRPYWSLTAILRAVANLLVEVQENNLNQKNEFTGLDAALNLANFHRCVLHRVLEHAVCCTFERLEELPPSFKKFILSGARINLLRNIESCQAHQELDGTIMKDVFTKQKNVFNFAALSTRLKKCLESLPAEQGSQKQQVKRKLVVERFNGWPVGLENNENNCWFNAVIQALFHVPVFRQLILNFVPPADIVDNSQYARSLQFVKELRCLFVLMVASKRKHVDPSKAIDIFKEAFNGPINNEVSVANCHDSQQDISECQHKLFEWLEDAFNLVESQTSAVYSDEMTSTANNNPIRKLFYGQYISTGFNQGTKFEKNELFGQLPLLVEGFKDIHESLEAATSKNEIENLIGKPPSASYQEQSFIYLPPVLLFELSRFKFNLGQPEKIHKQFEFPQKMFMDRYLNSNRLLIRQKDDDCRKSRETLRSLQSSLDRLTKQFDAAVTQLSEELEQERRDIQKEVVSQEEQLQAINRDPELTKCGYHLHAVLIHEGQAASGHYWAYIFSPTKNSWLKFNDVSVDTASWKEVQKDGFGGIGTSSAYCLVYVSDKGDIDHTLSSSNGDLPADLLKYVEEDNEDFDEDFAAWDFTPSKKSLKVAKTTNETVLSAMSQNDEAVRSTNDDAASCKRSAVQLGYWSDPYVQFFTKASDRKPPEISRGYFARVRSVQGLIRQFIERTNGDCQVINLGAGSDSWFWNLVDEGQTPRKAWIEIDFAECTVRKIHCIRSNQKLLDKVKCEEKDPTLTRTELHSSLYHLVACDLRDVNALSTALDSCGVDRLLPTAFIAECVLVYMSAESSKTLVRWIADQFQTAFFVNYEQVKMGDRFGKVMVDNLLARGCALAGVEHCMSLDTQKARFTDNGWQSAEAVDMMTVYKGLPAADIRRIESLEMLDDHDMLIQLCEHYCLCWARLQQSEHVVDSASSSTSNTHRRVDLAAITLEGIV